jgi:hypothetical protein
LAQGVNERSGRPITENPATRFLWIQAAEEDVENAAEMFVIFITADAAAQIQICRDGVKMILEKIGVLQHAGPDPLRVVVVWLVAEPVRFPIDNIALPNGEEFEYFGGKSFAVAYSSALSGKNGNARLSPLQ